MKNNKKLLISLITLITVSFYFITFIEINLIEM